jgi:hypothetical protein
MHQPGKGVLWGNRIQHLKKMAVWKKINLKKIGLKNRKIGRRRIGWFSGLQALVACIGWA